MPSQYITLRHAFEEWLRHKSAAQPAERKDLVAAAASFGTLLQEANLQLVVSRTPDLSTKTVLDPGVWPEGPHCYPLALHDRVINHRTALRDDRADYLKTPLELYHGQSLYLNQDAFLSWLRRGDSRVGDRDYSTVEDGSPESQLKVRIVLPSREPEASREIRDLIDFFRHRESTWPLGQHLPTEAEDAAAVEVNFPKWKVSRSALRYARKKGTSYKWTRQGRGRRK